MGERSKREINGYAWVVDKLLELCRCVLALNSLDQATGDQKVLNAKRILELANNIHFLYVRQNPAQQAKLIKMVLSNCKFDSVSVYPTYRKPFDVIFQRAQT
jgi:hypothetical protein